MSRGLLQVKVLAKACFQARSLEQDAPLTEAQSLSNMYGRNLSTVFDLQDSHRLQIQFCI